MISDTTARIERLGKEVVRTERDRTARIGAVVLAGHDDDLGVGRELQDLLQRPESFADAAGLRRQPEVECHDGGFKASQLRDRLLAVGCDRDFVAVERPLHLQLQRWVVLHDQQGTSLVGHATAPSVDGDSATARSLTRTLVPTAGSLCTSMLPPTCCTYCWHSKAPMPMPVSFVDWNGLNNRSRMNSAVIPDPRSLTSINTSSPMRSLRNRTSGSRPDASKAFCTRWASTRSSRSS